MKKTIESPFANCNAVLHVTPKKMSFRKEEFDVYDYYYVCDETKKEFTTADATDLTLKQLYNQYREKNNILFPEQIKQLREQYGITPVKMSEVLGFGENVYRNYEKGEIPSKSNAKTLDLITNPDNFIDLAEKSKLFSDREINDLKFIGVGIQNKSEKEILKSLLRNYSNEIDQFTGYSFRHFAKLANMIVFFLKENERAFTVRLNKYLFYSDFLSFKLLGSPISGYSYSAIENGPVLDNYKRLFGELWEEEYVENKTCNLGDKEVDKFVPIRDFDSTLFSNDEIEILKQISKDFKFKKTQELIDLSHNETGWKDNIADKGNISYQKYAPLLSI